MNDKELADAIVTLGIGEWDKQARAYSIRTSEGHWMVMSALLFVREWRVVGAVMEQCEEACWNINIVNGKRAVSLQFLDAARGAGVYYVSELDTPLARAILEARVEALS